MFYDVDRISILDWIQVNTAVYTETIFQIIFAELKIEKHISRAMKVDFLTVKIVDSPH